mmetsp:Transcript_23981/g.36802  ORF Transcript_23981/g.36802 Transcript_23981/m.36802 type:complete len:102 (-) Transcript_23981:13-318(-)
MQNNGFFASAEGDYAGKLIKGGVVASTKNLGMTGGFGSKEGQILGQGDSQQRIYSANPMGGRKGRKGTNIRLGSGSGPSSNIFSVRNGKLMLTNNKKPVQL